MKRIEGVCNPLFTESKDVLSILPFPNKGQRRNQRDGLHCPSRIVREQREGGISRSYLSER
jgi:hypothetical protein